MYTVKKKFRLAQSEPDLAHSLEPGLAHLRKFQLREAFNMSQTWLISLLLERLLLEKRNNYIFQKLMCL